MNCCADVKTPTELDSVITGPAVGVEAAPAITINSLEFCWSSDVIVTFEIFTPVISDPFPKPIP